MATFQIQFGDQDSSVGEDRMNQLGDTRVFVLATFDEKYLRMIDEGVAENYLEIVSRNQHVRTLKMEAPIMQVISCRDHRRAPEVKPQRSS